MTRTSMHLQHDNEKTAAHKCLRNEWLFWGLQTPGRRANPILVERFSLRRAGESAYQKALIAKDEHDAGTQ